MVQFLKSSRWALIPALLLVLLLALSACGIDLSGEPEILSEVEIQTRPTTAATPIPTAAAGAPEPVDGVAAPPAPAVTEPAEAPPAASTGEAPESGDVLAGDFDRGMALYLQECAACHGAQDGAGPSLAAMRDVAGERVEGLSAVEYLHQSIVDPGAFVVPGYEDIMPKDYGERLSQDDLDSLVKFILEFTPAAMAGAQGGEGAAPQGSPTDDPHAVLTSVPSTNGTLTVRGRIIQGTEGGASIPPDLPVEVYALDPHGAVVGIYEAACDAEGTYEIRDVARGEGFLYLVRTDYADIPQGAQTPAIAGDEEVVNADVTVYERTTSRDTVAISMARMLVNYAPINEFGLEVRLDLELINTGDQIVASDKLADRGWPISVEVELPVGAFGIQPMQSEGSQRYQVQMVGQIPVVQDTWPLRPGQRHTITILYYLPYEDEAVLDQAFGYPVMDASVLLPNDTVTFESEAFEEEGEFRYRVLSGGLRVEGLNPSEEIDPDDRTLIKAYDLREPLSADERIVFTLAGRPTRTVNVMNPAAQPADSGMNPLPYLFAGAGLAVLVMAGVMWWRQRGAAPPVPVARWQPPGRDATKEDLLRALAELDDAYAEGAIDDETYAERREVLKERLIPFLDDDNG